MLKKIYPILMLAVVGCSQPAQAPIAQPPVPTKTVQVTVNGPTTTISAPSSPRATITTTATTKVVKTATVTATATITATATKTATATETVERTATARATVTQTTGVSKQAINDDSVWDRIAQCESDNDWSINTGNGFYGGLQFTLESWRAVGGQGMPHEASKQEQIKRAKLLQAKQGWQAWPVCSKRR